MFLHQDVRAPIVYATSIGIYVMLFLPIDCNSPTSLVSDLSSASHVAELSGFKYCRSGIVTAVSAGWINNRRIREGGIKNLDVFFPL